jgi:hypothetical protein
MGDGWGFPILLRKKRGRDNLLGDGCSLVEVRFLGCGKDICRVCQLR